MVCQDALLFHGVSAALCNHPLLLAIAHRQVAKQEKEEAARGEVGAALEIHVDSTWWDTYGRTRVSLHTRRSVSLFEVRCFVESDRERWKHVRDVWSCRNTHPASSKH